VLYCWLSGFWPATFYIPIIMILIEFKQHHMVITTGALAAGRISAQWKPEWIKKLLSLDLKIESLVSVNWQSWANGITAHYASGVSICQLDLLCYHLVHSRIAALGHRLTKKPEKWLIAIMHRFILFRFNLILNQTRDKTVFINKLCYTCMHYAADTICSDPKWWLMHKHLLDSECATYSIYQ